MNGKETYCPNARGPFEPRSYESEAMRAALGPSKKAMLSRHTGTQKEPFRERGRAYVEMCERMLRARRCAARCLYDDIRHSLVKSARARPTGVESTPMVCDLSS
jgi:hypothetical protein